MPKKIYGATKDELAKAEREYGHILDDPAVTAFTDAMFTESFMSSREEEPSLETENKFYCDGVDNESVLKFEEEHGEEFYKTFREILKK